MALDAVFARNEFSFTELLLVNIIPSMLNARADLKIAPTFCGSSN